MKTNIEARSKKLMLQGVITDAQSYAINDMEPKAARRGLRRLERSI